MKGSRVIHATEAGWTGVNVRQYRDGEGPFLGAARHTLLGGQGEEPDLDFEVRYFEVAPGATPLWSDTLIRMPSWW